MRLDVDAAAPRDRGARGAADGLRPRRGGLGHPPCGQREHGGGRAHPRHRARQGPARLPALRLRRRGPGARLARGPHPPGAARARALRRGRHRRRYGLLAAPLAFDFVRTAPQRLDAADWDQREPRCSRRWRRRAARVLRGAGVADGEIRVRRTAEMRYVGPGARGRRRAAGGHARRRRASAPSPARSRPPTARSTAAPPSAWPSRR